jgi:hypothetical protein
MGCLHWKAVGSVRSNEEEADGLVRRMDDFGGYSRLRRLPVELAPGNDLSAGFGQYNRLQRPLTGRACSW